MSYCSNCEHEFVTYPDGKEVGITSRTDRCKHCGRFRFQINIIEKEKQSNLTDFGFPDMKEKKLKIGTKNVKR